MQTIGEGLPSTAEDNAKDINSQPIKVQQILYQNFIFTFLILLDI
jgi:hypothetical protein